jgi:PAS domain S-box-containing protein
MSVQHLPNILIVDDNEENLVLLEAVIRNININVISTLSGTEALEKTSGIDLILAIIDVSMPEMTGYELAIRMNEERPGEKVPVIFVTANNVRMSDVIKGYSSGAVDFIIKPIINVMLLSKINVFLDLYNQKQTILSNNVLLRNSTKELISINKKLKKREDNLVQEQLFTKALLDSIPGIFYLYSYPELRLVKWNKQHETLLGFETHEMEGRHALEWHSTEAKEAVIDSLKDFMEGGQVSVETTLLAKDGSLIPFFLTGVKFEDNGQNYLIGIGTDITIRKKAEEELKSSFEQLHQLTKHIEKVREEERLVISRDLHDDLGQALTAVKIDLGIIKRQVIDEDVVSKINKVSALVGDTIKTVQWITSELRPQIIDDLGLDAAIEWYTNEFAARNGIEIFLDITSDLPINPDASLTLFRILQESLTNIARHSKATIVEIGLNRNTDFIDFRISDNGIGITESQIKSKNSFGIISMKERAASLGAILDICSENGHGTVIKFKLPINHP